MSPKEEVFSNKDVPVAADVLIENPPVSVGNNLEDSMSLRLHNGSSSSAIQPCRSCDAHSVTSVTDSLCTETISVDHDDDEEEDIIEASGCVPDAFLATPHDGDENDSDLEECSGTLALHEHLIQNQDSLSELIPASYPMRRQQHPRYSSSKTSGNGDLIMVPEPRNNNIDASESPVVVLGVDISHLSRAAQFVVCASGVFGFNLLFGYLQELINVEVCNRNLGLFLAMMQFTGYTTISFLLRTYSLRHRKQQQQQEDSNIMDKSDDKHDKAQVPSHMYWTLGVLSAIDMAMTNMSMHYLNYPAKTLMKSSRVVFTMFFGVLIAHKKYRVVDYAVVMCMLFGLCIFMRADRTSDAIFEPMGVVLLTVSLMCDGATNIMSETIMRTYGVGQDELIFRMYSLALVAVTAAATWNGDLQEGWAFILQSGTYDEWQDGVPKAEATWSIFEKLAIVALFSSMGFFGSSCSAAITKNFGALTMSITSTARRATTLFISFFLFDNECTHEHITGVVIFITALTTKSFLSRTKDPAKVNMAHHEPLPLSVDLHMSTVDFDQSSMSISSKRKKPGRSLRS